MTIRVFKPLHWLWSERLWSLVLCPYCKSGMGAAEIVQQQWEENSNWRLSLGIHEARGKRLHRHCVVISHGDIVAVWDAEELAHPVLSACYHRSPKMQDPKRTLNFCLNRKWERERDIHNHFISHDYKVLSGDRQQKGHGKPFSSLSRTIGVFGTNKCRVFILSYSVNHVRKHKLRRNYGDMEISNVSLWFQPAFVAWFTIEPFLAWKIYSFSNCWEGPAVTLWTVRRTLDCF